ncbi:MAG: PASTA domain-containing protein [Elusimicrobia bacterium]|nr:PASTA domain-containing protein [Elusimicrobiota bacterium]
MKLKTGKILKFAASAVLFGFLAAFGFDIAMKIVTRQSAVVIVPDVKGKSLAEAMDILQKKKLYAVKDEEQISDETIPSGSVVRQNPSEGSVVKKGRYIKLTLSEGGNLIYVPDITGKNLSEAEIILTRANLSVGNVSKIYNDEVKRDLIIDQNPKAGQITAPKTLVDVIVSNGPASLMGFLVMPYLVGKSSSDAAAQLKEMGFDITETESIINDSVPPGTVLKQEPPPGEMLGGKNEIKLYVSQLSQLQNIKKTSFIFYQVPQDIKDRKVKIVVKDSLGTRTIYEKTESPGKKISLEVETLGKAWAIFYLDDVPVGKKEI